MKRLIIMLLLLSLIGCNQTNKTTNQDPQEEILVSGQSNAVYCDWSYFEEISGYSVKNIAVGGSTIEELIDDFYDTQPIDKTYSKLIFMHGEKDAIQGTIPSDYITSVHEFQNLLGVDDIYFSLVGRVYLPYKDDQFDAIRKAVSSEAKNVNSWHVGHYSAWTFRDRDMLIDSIHFSEDGCKEIMESINFTIKAGL